MEGTVDKGTAVKKHQERLIHKHIIAEWRGIGVSHLSVKICSLPATPGDEVFNWLPPGFQRVGGEVPVRVADGDTHDHPV